MTTTSGHSFYIGPIGSFYNQVNDTGSWEPLVIIIIIVKVFLYFHVILGKDLVLSYYYFFFSQANHKTISQRDSVPSIGTRNHIPELFSVRSLLSLLSYLSKFWNKNKPCCYVISETVRCTEKVYKLKIIFF